jgi:regulator of nucleoside diphosphate kinase
LRPAFDAGPVLHEEFSMSALHQDELLLTESNYARLSQLNGVALRDVLDAADVVPDALAPDDLVTMRGQVRVRHEASGLEQTLTLCWPEEVKPEEGRISVLSPIGTALLGRRAGAWVALRLPGGQSQRLRIEALL